MIRILKWLFATIGVALAAVVVLFLGTRGEYPVLSLVTDDASLPSVTISGIALHVRVIEGPPDADAIIVLHGGPGHDFRSLEGLAALSDSYRVIFYDQRGAGLSERVPAEDLTLEGHVVELGAVIDHFAPEGRPILIGHSWGATLAVAYLGQRPDDVARAILIEPGYLDAAGRMRWREESKLYMSGPAYLREAIVTGFRAQHVTGPDLSAQDDFLVGRMVHYFADHPENPYHCGSGYSAPSWRFGALSNQTMDAIPEVEINRIAANASVFDGPVLFMAGACNDWIGEPLQSEHLSRFADATLVVVPDAGHDVIWDNPDATLAIIRAFLHTSN